MDLLVHYTILVPCICGNILRIYYVFALNFVPICIPFLFLATCLGSLCHWTVGGNLNSSCDLYRFPHHVYSGCVPFGSSDSIQALTRMSLRFLSFLSEIIISTFR